MALVWDQQQGKQCCPELLCRALQVEEAGFHQEPVSDGSRAERNPWTNLQGETSSVGGEGGEDLQIQHHP